MTQTERMNAIAIIPARGGSKGIPRKNIRELGGKPLIWHAIHTALESGCFEEVVVTTDHDEIAHVAAECGARVHRRPAHLATDDATLDGVIHDVVEARGHAHELVVTLQPTSPLLRVETLREAMRRMRESPEIDTLISVVNDPRLSWVEKDGKIVPNYAKRVNRQLLPPLYRETGAFFISRKRCVTPTSRFGENVAVFEVSQEEAIDIDRIEDWWIVEKQLDRKRLAIRVDGNRPIGFGHVYRMLLLANRLLDHHLHFFLDDKHTEAVAMVADAFYPHTAAPREEICKRILAYNPDILILDILDTTAEEVLAFKERGIFVVTFEDLGPGMAHSDLTINALYQSAIPYPHVFSGPDYYCLREEFAHTAPRQLSDQVERIVVTFGGADPSDQTHRTVTALAELIRERGIRLVVILGLGYPPDSEARLLADIRRLGISDRVEAKRQVSSMATEFKSADLVVTSCGRTMYEVASVGTPALLIAQNAREMAHAFGHAENGFVNLGLGADLRDPGLVKAVRELLDHRERREEMRARLLAHDFRGGLERVTRLILEKHRERTRERQ